MPLNHLQAKQALSDVLGPAYRVVAFPTNAGSTIVVEVYAARAGANAEPFCRLAFGRIHREMLPGPELTPKALALLGELITGADPEGD